MRIIGFSFSILLYTKTSILLFICFYNDCVHHKDGEEAFKDLAEEKEDGGDDDDEEERFVDADKLEEGSAVDEGGGGGVAEPRPAASWVHHQNLEGQFSVLLHGCQFTPLLFSTPVVLPVGHQGARASRATTRCTETRCSAALTAQPCGSCSRCRIH